MSYLNKFSTKNSFRAYEKKIDNNKSIEALNKSREKQLLEQEKLLKDYKFNPNDPRLVKKEKNPNIFLETYKCVKVEIETYFMESFRNIIIKSNILDKDMIISNTLSINKTTNNLLENLLENLNLINLNKSEIGELLYETILDKIERNNTDQSIEDINNKISIIENTYADILHRNILNVIIKEKQRKQERLILEEKVEEKRNIKEKDRKNLRNTSLLEALLTFNSKLHKDEILNESEEMEKSNFCMSESIIQYSFLETLKIMNLIEIDETRFIDKLKFYKIK